MENLTENAVKKFALMHDFRQWCTGSTEEIIFSARLKVSVPWFLLKPEQNVLCCNCQTLKLY